MDQLLKRRDFAVNACLEAGDLALSFFRDRSNLTVDVKGAQDWVSEADKSVERFLRDRLAANWPDDGIVGEEFGTSAGSSGFQWVIDPIDGTTNFVNGLPTWTVVLACVSEAKTRIGVIHDPIVRETFVAVRDGGATLNGTPMSVAQGVPLESGTVAVGYSNRVEARSVVPLLESVIASGAMFHRNASGALSLAYVAAGRLLGYLEEHMNAWDCLAGQLLVREAGGRVEDQDADEMIASGGRVIVAAPDVFDRLKAMAEAAWTRA